uniref:Uncharacterized protein n=1 Tax=Candidatus Kentrum sp. SD TaxID=2126332 RepID=A0A450YK46_9GAMM|nr:MAG: hypothetical protein BECKSD772F_GA0070984_110713 [Candidatus Kentron sp. SD]VFK47785.1 MAG: hypothetical protein BECKSD772E_GA0070983_110513 [Candidatus Kentron sp. SD]
MKNSLGRIIKNFWERFWIKSLVLSICVIGAVFAFIVAVSPIIVEDDFFIENSEKIGDIGVLVTFMSLVIAVIIAIMEGFQSNQLKEQINQLQGMSKNIQDITRKPLTDIIDIISVCDELLGKAEVTNSRIWFVGLTLAFGIPHNTQYIQKKWEDKGNKGSLEDVCNAFNRKLTAMLGGQPREGCIVTLEESRIEDDFLRPLYSREGYKEELSDWEKPDDFFSRRKELLVTYHKKVCNAAEAGCGSKITFTDKIPIQVLAVGLKDTNPSKKACVVFHVGTQNIASIKPNRAIGFYTELPDMCDMFTDFAESLSGGLVFQDQEP